MARVHYSILPEIKTFVLVLVLEMSVLRVVNLYFYRTSSQGIGVPSGPFLVSIIGAILALNSNYFRNSS